jgi:hypothetical protein
MDPQSWPAEPQDYKQNRCSQEGTASRPGEPQDCNQAAQECTAEQDTGVQWRSL